MNLATGLVAGALMLGSTAALAQMNHGDMQHGPKHGSGQTHPDGHGSTKPKGDTGPSSAAFRAANRKMHEGMDIALTGNADVDFVRGMIPHHQGAIEMARIQIAFGKDPQIRKLAEEIVKAQESEIARMQEWLKKNAK
jgi:uncharacterized protein (DUF305 family)